MFRALSRLLCRQDKQKRPIASWTRRPPPPHPPSQPPRLHPLRPRLSSLLTLQLLIFIAHHLIALRPAPLSCHNLIPATIATFAPMPLLYPSQNIRRYTSTARWPQGRKFTHSVSDGYSSGYESSHQGCYYLRRIWSMHKDLHCDLQQAVSQVAVSEKICPLCLCLTSQPLSSPLNSLRPRYGRRLRALRAQSPQNSSLAHAPFTSTCS